MKEGNKPSGPESKKRQESQIFSSRLVNAYSSTLSANTAPMVEGHLKNFNAVLRLGISLRVSECLFFSNYDIFQLSQQLSALPIQERSSVMLEFLKKKGLEQQYLKILQPSR